MDYKIHYPEQPIILELSFKNVEEVKNLYESLTQWTPTSGWSDLAREFFTMLQDAYFNI